MTVAEVADRDWRYLRWLATRADHFPEKVIECARGLEDDCPDDDPFNDLDSWGGMDGGGWGND
jgi:hypothetical protein